MTLLTFSSCAVHDDGCPMVRCLTNGHPLHSRAAATEGGAWNSKNKTRDIKAFPNHMMSSIMSWRNNENILFSEILAVFFSEEICQYPLNDFPFLNLIFVCNKLNEQACRIYLNSKWRISSHELKLIHFGLKQSQFEI